MSWLPPLVELQAFGGDFAAYLEHLYGLFLRDFIRYAVAPVFRGRLIRLRRGPMADGREPTFWHLISEGPEEDERTPDLRRCERIQWPRAMVDKVGDRRLRVWAELRGSDKRWQVALGDFSYLVVLADRKHEVVLLTAFCVEHGHRRDKLRRAFDGSTEKYLVEPEN